MENELLKQTGKPSTWDNKRIWGVVVGVIGIGGLMALLGWVIWNIVLPFLLGFIAMAILIPIACILGAIVFYYLTQPNTWLAFRIIGESWAEKTLGWVIEMDRLGIMQMDINDAKEKREQLRLAGASLRSEENRLGTIVRNNDQIMREKQAQISILQTALQRNPENEDAQDNLEIVTNDFTNSKTIIDVLKPQQQNVQELIKFTDKAYRKSGVAITNQQNKLNTLKTLLSTSTTSANAVKAAMKALKGDPQLAMANEMAIESIRNEIYANQGALQSSLKITSQIMNQKDLEDASKVALAAKMASSFNDKQFDYSTTIEQQGPTINSGNQYIAASAVVVPEPQKLLK